MAPSRCHQEDPQAQRRNGSHLLLQLPPSTQKTTLLTTRGGPPREVQCQGAVPACLPRHRPGPAPSPRAPYFLPLIDFFLLCPTNFYSTIRACLKNPFFQGALPASRSGPVGPTSSPPGSPPCVTLRSHRPHVATSRQLSPCSQAVNSSRPSWHQHLMPTSPDTFHMDGQELLGWSPTRTWLKGDEGACVLGWTLSWPLPCGW